AALVAQRPAGDSLRRDERAEGITPRVVERASARRSGLSTVAERRSRSLPLTALRPGWTPDGQLSRRTGIAPPRRHRRAAIRWPRDARGARSQLRRAHRRTRSALRSHLRRVPPEVGAISALTRSCAYAPSRPW